MWGCDWMPGFTGMSWMGGFFPGGILSLLFFGLIVLGLIFLAVKVVRAIRFSNTDRLRDTIDSLEILKMRFAKGEINQEEYNKMKGVLLQS